eukprot:Lithocolla_globosa_v1_NODE_2100_length_2169_cov_3.244560.p3 type:complete len:117 gc:universal NODE_2100_length_2169_cov_3.244560:492-842(+)
MENISDIFRKVDVVFMNRIESPEIKRHFVWRTTTRTWGTTCTFIPDFTRSVPLPFSFSPSLSISVTSSIHTLASSLSISVTSSIHTLSCSRPTPLTLALVVTACPPICRMHEAAKI